MDLPNGLVIDVTREKEIALNRPAAERSYGRAIKPTDHAIAAFEKIGEDGVISLTEEGAGKIDEEVFHVAMAMALTPEERQSILYRYNNNEEQAARAYQDWLADGNAKPDTIWQKIKDFFTAIREAFFPTERTPYRKDPQR